MLIERRLSNGEPCTIELQFADRAASRLNIVILVGGKEVRVPEEFLADLPDCALPDGVQVADFADDIFLLLAGGEGDSAWQAKITIRDGRAVERELKKGAAEPLITRYQPPCEGSIAGPMPHLIDNGHK